MSGIALRRVSDMACLEHGLSIIVPRKPSERSKRTVYPKRKSYREEIRESIDICMEQKPKDMEELIKLIQEMGYEIKRGYSKKFFEEQKEQAEKQRTTEQTL